jgi:hypothetical protein
VFCGASETVYDAQGGNIDMADTRWIVSMDGKQLDGSFGNEEVTKLIRENPGKSIFVWHPGQQQWVDPSKMPEFSTGAPMPPPPPAAVPPAAFAGKQQIMEQAGFLKTLLDFRFQNFITVRIIPILYVIVMVAIALGAVAFFFISGGGAILTGIRFKSFGSILMGLFMMLLTPVFAVVYLCMVRIWFEVVLQFFRMREDLDKLVARAAPEEPAKK